MSGSEGKGLRLEGIEIKLTGDNAADYSVEYQTQIENEGWAQGWVKDGEMSGSSGKGLRLEAIEIKIVQVEADLTAYTEALEAVNEEDYTPASWAAYQEVVLANVMTTADLQSEVDSATAAIVAAQENLVELGKVTGLVAINATTVEVTFEEELASVDKSEFAIEGLTVANAAVKQTNKKVVVLTTSAQVGGTEYKLVYQGVDTGLTFTGISAVIPTTISLDSNSIQSKVGSEVTLKANIGQATAGVAVTFNVDAPAGSLNNDVIAEAYTNAEGIATYSYTQYAAGTDAVAVYPTGAPTTRATAKVFWGVSDILTVTESATGGAVNGTTRTYTVTLVNPANSVALNGQTVNVTLWENVNSVDNTTANDTNAVVADPSTGGTITPFQSATNEREFKITTDANGKATFTLTGSNTTATPVVFVDSNAAALATAGIAGNANKRIEAAELQVKMPAVAFTGAQAAYTFDFAPMVAAEYASGLVNTREYKAVVKKADGTVYANGNVVVGLDELIDNNLVTTTTAVFTTKAGADLGQASQVVTADANGIVTFYVAEPVANRSNVSATPAIWIDLDAAGNTNKVREAGEPQALAPKTTFQAQLAQGLSNLDINTTPAVKDGPFVTNDVINSRFEIRNQSNTLSTTAGFNRVTYTVTNTSGVALTFAPRMLDATTGTPFTAVTTTFAVGGTQDYANDGIATITLNAGSSVTLAGTAAGYVVGTDTSATNAATLRFTAGVPVSQDNTLSISATGTTVRATVADDSRNAGSVSQAAKTATIKKATAATNGQVLTGEVLGYSVVDSATDFGRVVVKLDGSGDVVTFVYGTNRSGANISDSKIYLGTDGTFANVGVNFNQLNTVATVLDQKDAFNKFENAFEVGNRVNATIDTAANAAGPGSFIYLANVKNVSKSINSGNDLTPVVVAGPLVSPVTVNTAGKAVFAGTKAKVEFNVTNAAAVAATLKLEKAITLGDSTSLNGKTVELRLAAGDVLAVNLVGDVLKIDLANTTPGNNTDALIQAAVRAKGGAYSDVTVTGFGAGFLPAAIPVASNTFEGGANQVIAVAASNQFNLLQTLVAGETITVKITDTTTPVPVVVTQTVTAGTDFATAGTVNDQAAAIATALQAKLGATQVVTNPGVPSPTVRIVQAVGSEKPVTLEVSTTPTTK
ncbi:hypothetical protein [Acetobacterium malicum]|uniref:hypothetical protein n=1 Tax=Acetobacterium malicum TaxID=52692 RepID=UPI000410472D